MVERHMSQPGGPSRAANALFFVGALVPGTFYLLVVLSLIVADVAYTSPAVFLQTIRSEQILFALKLSLATSITSTLLSLVVAVPTGYVLARWRFPGSVLIDSILDLPIVLPPLVVGVSLLVFFRTAPGRFIENSVVSLVYEPAGIILAQAVVACAFGIRTVKAAFQAVNPRYENVARTLGAGRLRSFLRVSLPMARNGIIAGTVLVWARSIGEFGPIIIFSGATRMHTEVLPTSIYLELSIGHIEAALAVALLMMLMGLVTLVTIKSFGGAATSY